MKTEKIPENAPTASTDSSKSSFFRQSGWMMFATLTAGISMFSVHFVAYPFLGDQEYGLFGTLLAMLNVLMIPSIALQTTVAQETAGSLSSSDEAHLAGDTRGLFWWTFILWLGFVVFVAVFQKQFIDTLTITSPLTLWLVVLISLAQLWTPIAYGILQGKQNFLWLGWAQMGNGFGRLLSVSLIVAGTVFVFKGHPVALHAIIGALLGFYVAMIMGMYHSRHTWGARQRFPFDWKAWLAQIVPLTLGLGASQFIFSVDMIIVRGIYGENQTGNYSASGMIARGLVMFTAPLVTVMFPKMAHSLAMGRKSNVLAYTLLGTAVLGVFGAAGCTCGAFILGKIASDPTFGQGIIPATLLETLHGKSDTLLILSTLIPWLVWCLFPLAFSNVFLTNLIARKSYRVTLYLVLVVVAYVTAAVSFADVVNPVKSGLPFIRIVQILGVFNLVFLAVCMLFNWADQPGKIKSS